jgi:hypothetical protein
MHVLHSEAASSWCRTLLANMMSSSSCTASSARQTARACAARPVHCPGAGGPLPVRQAAYASKSQSSAQQQRSVVARAADARAGSSGEPLPTTLRRHLRNSAIAFSIGAAAPIIASMALRTAIPFAVAALALAVFVTGSYSAPVALGGTVVFLQTTGSAASSPYVILACGAAFMGGYLVHVVTKKMRKRS